MLSNLEMSITTSKFLTFLTWNFDFVLSRLIENHSEFIKNMKIHNFSKRFNAGESSKTQQFDHPNLQKVSNRSWRNVNLENSSSCPKRPQEQCRRRVLRTTTQKSHTFRCRLRRRRRRKRKESETEAEAELQPEMKAEAEAEEGRNAQPEIRRQQKQRRRRR